MKYKRGFTLIELLVVIAIIGLLSSVVLASLNTTRIKARDVRRMSDINQLVRALQFYYDDHNMFPGASGCIGVIDGQTCWGDRLLPGNTALKTSLETYINPLPTDPLPNRGWGDRYYYIANGSVSINCGGYTLPGTFLIYRPDQIDGSTYTCPVGQKACCSSGPCNNAGGHYCAVKL